MFRSLKYGAVLAAYLLTASHSGYAAVFNDDFTTNPLTTRWCERFHNVHWNSTNKWMVAFASSTCDGGGCCGTCISDCSNAPGTSTLLITSVNRTGTIRSAAADVGWPTTLVQATGEHPAVFSVVHPNCHTGYEATIFAESGGTYQLVIFRPTDSTRMECDDYATTNSGAITGVSLSLSTTPRYKLSLSTEPTSGGSQIFAFASLKDNQTGMQLAALGWFSDYPATWYNVTAKRFGIGGKRLSTQTNAFRFDNFQSTF